jgi:hypothetical protein
LFTIFVTTTILALEQAQQLDRTTLPLLGVLLAAGVVALVLLVHQERRAPSPLIPLSLLGLPAIWRSDALAACLGAALLSLITLLPIYLEVVRGLSPGTTGLLLVPLTIGIGAGSLVTGRLVSDGPYYNLPGFRPGSCRVESLVSSRVLWAVAQGAPSSTRDGDFVGL